MLRRNDVPLRGNGGRIISGRAFLQNCKRPRPLSHLALLDASSPKERDLGKTAHFAVELETNPLSLLTAFAASSPEGGAFRHLPVSRVKPPPFGGGGIAQR